MKSFRDIRVLPVVLIAIFSLAVLKVAGLVLDGGYVFDYQPQSNQKSWAQDTLNFPGSKFDPDSQAASEIARLFSAIERSVKAIQGTASATNAMHRRAA